MAIALPSKLFFKDNRDYKVGTISFDLILSERHNMSNEITQYNVEDGSSISDHIRNNLENGTLTGLITNYSLKTGFFDTNRAQDAFDAFIRLWKERTLVTIITVMKVYENVAIVSADIGRDEGTGEAISLNISFRQVKTVKLKTVEIDTEVKVNDMKSDQNRQSSPEWDAGRQSGEQQSTEAIVV